jgi:hypothetical protein
MSSPAAASRRPGWRAVLGAACLGPLAACATGPREASFDSWGEAAGYAISQAQSPDGYIGCTASRTIEVQGRSEMTAVGVYRVPSGGRVMALAGGIAGARLGDRRQVPVEVSLPGAAPESGLGSLTGTRYFALTSGQALDQLAQGSTATIRFHDGPTLRQTFAPVVVASVLRCYDDLMQASGVAPPRAPLARGTPARKDAFQDVLDVRID